MERDLLPREPDPARERFVLREEFDPANPVWLVKDPRLCLVLDLWRAVGDALGRTIKCVVVVRHPDEIAASLERREEMPFQVVIALQGFYWRSLKKQALIAGAAGESFVIDPALVARTVFKEGSGGKPMTGLIHS